MNAGSALPEFARRPVQSNRSDPARQTAARARAQRFLAEPCEQIRPVSRAVHRFLAAAHRPLCEARVQLAIDRRCETTVEVLRRLKELAILHDLAGGNGGSKGTLLERTHITLNRPPMPNGSSMR